MFSEYFQSIKDRIHKFANNKSEVSKQRLNVVLEKATSGENLTSEDVLLLLNCAYEKDKRDQIIDTANQIKEDYYGKKIKKIIPLILSNICVNKCLYCGYSSESTIPRNRLDFPTFKSEFDYVFDMNYRHIELVLAEDPYFTAELLSKYIKYGVNKIKPTKTGGITINLAPKEKDEYKILQSSGLSGIYMWQESYDTETYKKYHPTDTKKGDFTYRINSYERMIDAGVKGYGVGVLFGLGEPKFEVLSLIEHCNFIEREYGLMPSMFGIPRLKKSTYAKNTSSDYIVGDDLFRTIVAIYRLAFPATNIFVNSRETMDMQLDLIKGGGDVVVFDCSTYPGGYTKPTKYRQFKHYVFSFESDLERLEKDGYDIVDDFDENWNPSIRKVLK